ncbi:tetraspanin-19-like [Rhododendron vialii]|uniref:tetraspanin-19-like n=1 Tax=Rhododendron vialii TaxID=182163 RepID=UPI00265F1F57|nr:tetraspanin-19-like [Rhododendron vialii]
MKDTMKCCVQLFLKLVNSIMGIVGISMILYSSWMVRVWQRDMEGSSSGFHNHSIPWFIYAFLGIGITLCAITCLGHVAAKTANPHCLSAYMVTIFLLLLAETALISDIILNSDWEKDLPEDRTGRFDDFEDFVEPNFDTCKWIGLLIVLAQGCSILLATVLKTLEKDTGKHYDSDDDYAAHRLPFVNNSVHPLPCTVADFPLPSKSKTWTLRKDSQ